MNIEWVPKRKQCRIFKVGIDFNWRSVVKSIPSHKSLTSSYSRDFNPSTMLFTESFVIKLLLKFSSVILLHLWTKVVTCSSLTFWPWRFNFKMLVVKFITKAQKWGSSQPPVKLKLTSVSLVQDSKSAKFHHFDRFVLYTMNSVSSHLLPIFLRNCNFEALLQDCQWNIFLNTSFSMALLTFHHHVHPDVHNLYVDSYIHSHFVPLFQWSHRGLFFH